MRKRKFTQEEKDNWIPEEFYDIIHVLEMGAVKHGLDNYLLPEIPNEKFTLLHKNNTASMFRHLAESCAREDINKLAKDKESGLDPDLHLAIRALMAYTRRCRHLRMEL